MREAMLLKSILNCLSSNKETYGYDVYCDSVDGIEVSLKTSNKVDYYSSMLTNRDVIYGSYDYSIFDSCLDSLKLYLKRCPHCIILVHEGVDSETGDIVYVKVETVKKNKESLLLLLCRELDKCSLKLGVRDKAIGNFVYDSYDEYTDIFPLHTKINGVESEEIIKVYDNTVLDSNSMIFQKVPLLRNEMVEGILQCIWSLIGDYVIIVKLVKKGIMYFPVMYSLYLDGTVSISELC